MKAVLGGNAEITRLLIDAGSDLEAQENVRSSSCVATLPYAVFVPPLTHSHIPLSVPLNTLALSRMRASSRQHVSSRVPHLYVTRC